MIAPARFTWPDIRRGERVSFIGPSGSGKTEVAKALLRTQKNAIVLDTKRVEHWEDIGETLGPQDIYRVRAGRYVYRVEPAFLTNPEHAEKFFAWALSAGNRAIYVDEQVDVPNSDAQKVLAVQGRASGVGLWVATQRPHGVPLYTLSECNHQFIFRLRLKRDRERVEEATAGAPIDWDSLKVKYTFVYVNGDGEVSEHASLNLDS
jgi:energy-coupling factor transporter ATP-binding protein EcfA2